MAFSKTASAHLAQLDKTVNYTFELRTNQPESDTWQEYPFADFRLTRDINTPATLTIDLLNDELEFSDEQSATCRTQLFAEARLSASVAGESAVLFLGRVYRVTPRDGQFNLLCQDWLGLIHESECEIDLVPEETDEIAPARQLALIGGGEFGSAYGFTFTGAGDLAFNAGGTARRSWAAGDIRLCYDSAASVEVPPQHYRINLTGGTATILEDTAGKTYYATGVRCYLEDTLDWAAVFEAALTYPVADGGLGLTAAELDLPDTGIDAAGPVYFRGRTGDLVNSILKQQQANLRLWFDPDSAKFTLRVVEQAATGGEDWELLSAQSITQPRDIRELYSRVVVTGLSERPRNALTEDAVDITPRTGAGTWFSWDGISVGADSDFSTVGPLVYDGDWNLGAAVHNLPACENGGTDQYDSWYDFVTIDLGAVGRIHRVRAVLPGSRNYNASAGHQGLFWPGIRLLASDDGTDWRLLTAQICGRFPPGEMLEARNAEILCPCARYLRVLLGAYKHGFENQADPSIGLAELEVYTAENYHVAKCIDGCNPSAEYTYTDGTSWSRYHPALWTRLQERHRSCFIDRSGELNEYLAHDYALDQLAECVRLFQQVAYRAVCDPRIRLYDTVTVADDFNGDVGSILVERIVLSPALAEISGTNYLAAVLGT
ncbi:hypothetical protein JW859_01690 [bacterium]|nr:hypothetical protein [bacterium]